MDERADPIQIIARPGASIAKDRQQALGVWVHLARKAGWQVEVRDDAVEWPAGERGLVDIEGLRYLIRVGPRGRSTAILVPDEHVGAHVADMALGHRSFPSQPVFAATVWAEPIID